MTWEETLAHLPNQEQDPTVIELGERVGGLLYVDVRPVGPVLDNRIDQHA